MKLLVQQVPTEVVEPLIDRGIMGIFIVVLLFMICSLSVAIWKLYQNNIDMTNKYQDKSEKDITIFQEVVIVVNRIHYIVEKMPENVRKELSSDLTSIRESVNHIKSKF